ncbi:hypothetical protein BC937DRAFT_92972 [Endogone sp. FLAS-F59071]|nr:hypothetical protein BC937DRAFT_92972 [Endogone sp. FLAS-F59071]|eukprot:RUS15044.1 hypothetical protein BC937DRAFT_92972 [Endogone sp. FLAS-F59071]
MTCTAKGNPAFQLYFSTSKIFWDLPVPPAPPISGGYTPIIPPAFAPAPAPAPAPLIFTVGTSIANAIIIDLCNIQELVLMPQN